MRQKVLESVDADLDEIFSEFYKTILSNAEFSAYFSSQEQVNGLLEKQIAFFKASFLDSDDALKQRYIDLGEMHYGLHLPFNDFLYSINLLEQGMIHSIYRAHDDPSILDSCFNFFNTVRAYTAKGYLNKTLDNDIKDIDRYLERVSQTSESYNVITIDRFIWLKNLIFAIQKENRALAPHFFIEPEILTNIHGTLRDDDTFMEHIQDMISRIRIDASNIFFFLEKKDYTDALPLYRELLSIYKLSMMLSNLLTVAQADTVLHELTKDALTGLLARRSMDSILGKEFAIADAQNYQISLIFIDLDNFKRINDEHGHEIGDLVLKKVSEVILKSIRATDFAFRIGGDEILLLLKAAPANVARQQAELIQREIENLAIEHNGLTVSITASLGVNTFSRPFKQTAQEAVSRVDKLMYQAKSEGRNKVVGAQFPG